MQPGDLLVRTNPTTGTSRSAVVISYEVGQRGGATGMWSSSWVTLLEFEADGTNRMVRRSITQVRRDYTWFSRV